MSIYKKILSLFAEDASDKSHSTVPGDGDEEFSRLIKAGNEREDAGQSVDALRIYEQAIQLSPDNSSGYLNKGNSLLAMGRVAEAIQSYENAIRLKPDYAAAYYNLGNAKYESRQLESALLDYQKAIKLKPDFANAWVAQGNVLGDTGRGDQAIASYQKALDIEPGQVEVYRNLGFTFRQIGCLAEASEAFSTAILFDPTSITSRCDLANVFREMGQVEKAVSTARKACELEPMSPSPRSLLLFCLSHSGAISPRELYAEHCRFGEQFESANDSPTQVHSNSKEPDRIIKVGVISADLRNHAVSSFFEPVYYLLLKAKRIELYIYDNGGEPDDVSRRMKSKASVWREISRYTTNELYDLIRADVIDVLIDLSGHTPGHRLLTFAKKPAPVQLSWLGYPGTTGMRSIDYYVADSHFLPPGEFDDYFSEKIMRLPANAPFQSIENPPPVNELPALRHGYVTFGSFNRLDKISEEVVEMWARLLCLIPDAKMIIGGMPLKGEFTEIIDWFRQGGVLPNRLAFFRRSSMSEYLKLHHQVDVCLDTFPYGGGTTTCHALSMGVPTLTMAGSTPAAASSRSILSHAGIKDLFVAISQEDFLAKGQWCAAHIDELAKLRQELRSRFQRSNMMQPKLVADGLETAVCFAWKRWCQNQPPQAFEVTHQAGQLEVVLQ